MATFDRGGAHTVQPASIGHVTSGQACDVTDSSRDVTSRDAAGVVQNRRHGEQETGTEPEPVRHSRVERDAGRELQRREKQDSHALLVRQCLTTLKCKMKAG